MNTRDRLILFVAQGFGTGRAPRAPGTVGTLPGVLLFIPLAALPVWAQALTAGVLFLAGIPICARAAVLLGRDDPPSVVWDEIVGILVTLIASAPEPASLLAGFALFRLFDIWKPWPVGWIDRHTHGGLGIMLDDLVAGLIGLTVLLAARALGVGI